jgi:DNA-binding GntR family transcriptional regulator
MPWRCPRGSDIYHVQRLRFANEAPLAMLRNHLPAANLRLDRETLERQGLYQILRGAGRQLKFAPSRTRLATPLEYGTHVYRASAYSFELTLMSS